MKLRNRIIIIALIFVFMIVINCNSVFAEYVIQVVSGAPAWKNISVSDAYDACQNLNTTYSTLGTESLKAHLTTNADWYAVSLLTYSAYGSQNGANTTANKSGIVFPIKWNTLEFVSALSEGYTVTNDIKSLATALEAGSPYVELTMNVRDSNEPGRGLLTSEYLTTTLGSMDWEGNNYYAMGRTNLFGVRRRSSITGVSSGAANGEVAFRPAIWNK